MTTTNNKQQTTATTTRKTNPYKIIAGSCPPGSIGSIRQPIFHIFHFLYRQKAFSFDSELK
jgi:hypothetical protein